MDTMQEMGDEKPNQIRKVIRYREWKFLAKTV